MKLQILAAPQQIYDGGAMYIYADIYLYQRHSRATPYWHVIVLAVIVLFRKCSEKIRIREQKKNIETYFQPLQSKQDNDSVNWMVLKGISWYHWV